MNPVPTVTGGPKLVGLLTEDLKDLTGAQLHVETDAVEAVEGIARHIEEKRDELGI